MTKQYPNNHFMSEHFDVLVDICASGTRRNWKKAKSTGIVRVIATKQRTSFLGHHFNGMPTASMPWPKTCDHQTDESENH